MFSNEPFYFSLTKKYVVAFGDMFNNISIVRRDPNGAEIERFRVPIIYAPKEKYIERLFSDPDLNREVQTILPRMSFEITGISYNSAVKQNTLLRSAKGNTATRVSSQYIGVPYTLNFDLNIYSRNIDDGTYIVEQILPYFTPDYTITGVPISQLGFVKDMPLTLDAISNHIEHEGGFDQVRYVNWTLSFSMQVYYYGPVSTPKIIRKVIANIYNDPSLQAGYIVRVNLNQGNNGDFQISDTVYSGNNITTANAFGTVLNWFHDEAKLYIGGAQGQFRVGQTVRGASSNAAYNILSFDATPLKLATINVVPKPINAEPTDNYGYDTTIVEYYVPIHANT